MQWASYMNVLLTPIQAKNTSSQGKQKEKYK